eukprot:PhF_6_TR20762/c0_g1_i1/m.29789
MDARLLEQMQAIQQEVRRSHEENQKFQNVIHDLREELSSKLHRVERCVDDLERGSAPLILPQSQLAAASRALAIPPPPPVPLSALLLVPHEDLCRRHMELMQATQQYQDEIQQMTTLLQHKNNEILQQMDQLKHVSELRNVLQQQSVALLELQQFRAQFMKAQEALKTQENVIAKLQAVMANTSFTTMESNAVSRELSKVSEENVQLRKEVDQLRKSLVDAQSKAGRTGAPGPDPKVLLQLQMEREKAIMEKKAAEEHFTETLLARAKEIAMLKVQLSQAQAQLTRLSTPATSSNPTPRQPVNTNNNNSNSLPAVRQSTPGDSDYSRNYIKPTMQSPPNLTETMNPPEQHYYNDSRRSVASSDFRGSVPIVARNRFDDTPVQGSSRWK